MEMLSITGRLNPDDMGSTIILILTLQHIDCVI